MPLTIYRRHTPSCSHQSRDYLKCSCPLWADGYIDGRRVRESLGTRDMARGRKKLTALESPDRKALKPLTEAVEDFLQHSVSNGVVESSIRKYRFALGALVAFLSTRGLDVVSDIDADTLDDFRASRNLAPITSANELRLLRSFLGHCLDRRWTEDNPAKRIKPPRKLRPADVVPYTAAEVADILAACDRIGHSPFERIRARAMVLTMRYTALRIGDVATLAKDRISADGDRWRMYLRTEKNGKPVFLPIPEELKDALDAVPTPKDSRHYFWNGAGSQRTMTGVAQRVMRSVFRRSGVKDAHAHRFRHTLATEILENGGSFEEVADVLGNTSDVVRKHYAKWSPKRQARIDDLMQRIHGAASYTPAKLLRVK